MKSVYQYNQLHNKTISRSEIVSLLELAKVEEQFLIIERLQSLLDNHSDDEFKVVLSSEMIETVPSSFLACFDCCTDEMEFESEGLSKPVSPSDVYDLITNKMIELIRIANGNENTKKWNAKDYGTGYLVPFNFVSKKRYRGVNVLMLSELEPLENPFFMTFKQIEEKGGQLRRGSKAKQVVYFVELFKIEDKERSLSLSSYDREKVKDFVKVNNIKKPISSIPMLKYYNVFNGADIDGIDFDLENFKIGFIDNEKPADEENKLPIAEAIIRNYPKPQPKFTFGGDKAYHQGGGVGLIRMPYLSDFETVNDYYRVFFHELSHSTGSPNRLNRKLGNKFGSKDYAFEELIAEFGATFLSAEAGIIWHNPSNHAAYLKNWNSVLTHLKDDNKFIMRASTEAQKVADFVLQFDDKGNPLYFKDLETPVQPKKEKVSKTTTKVSKTSAKVESTQLELQLSKPKVDQVHSKPSKSISDLKKYGFVCASEIDKQEPKDVFVLPGSLGKFLQKIQPHKALILIKGTKHTSKSQLAMQIANAFGEMGKPVAYIDYEQGGVESKDTVDSVNRNTTAKGREMIAIIGVLENPFRELKEFCKHCSIIIADSVTDLRITADQLNDLRNLFPKVIWCFISQVKENGEMYGGNKMAHNPTMIIQCHPSENPALRYATLEKNRGNDTSLMYSIFSKKVIKSVPVEKSKK